MQKVASCLFHSSSLGAHCNVAIPKIDPHNNDLSHAYV
jgi:hypothetical protein